MLRFWKFCVSIRALASQFWAVMDTMASFVQKSLSYKFYAIKPGQKLPVENIFMSNHRYRSLLNCLKLWAKKHIWPPSHKEILIVNEEIYHETHRWFVFNTQDIPIIRWRQISSYCSFSKCYIWWKIRHAMILVSAGRIFWQRLTIFSVPPFDGKRNTSITSLLDERRYIGALCYIQ